MTDLIQRILWVLSIVAILGLSVFGRPWQQYLTQQLGGRLLLWLLLGILCVVLIVGIMYLRRIVVAGKSQPWLWLMSGLFVLLAIILTGRPEEMLHFITFGIYGYLSALMFGWLPGLLLCLGLSMGDELLQWWLPERVGDWHDVGINLTASLYGALLIWLAKRKA